MAALTVCHLFDSLANQAGKESATYYVNNQKGSDRRWIRNLALGAVTLAVAVSAMGCSPKTVSTPDRPAQTVTAQAEAAREAVAPVSAAEKVAIAINAVNKLAMQAYTHERSDGPTIRTLFKIANDFFGDDVEAFNRALKEVFGIDGVVEEYEGHAHYVAFFPEQIHILERLTVEEARARLDEGMARVERPRSS